MKTIDLRSPAERNLTIESAFTHQRVTMSRSWLINAALAVVLAGVLLIPRWTDLDALVTADEPFWLARSANFYQALSSGEFAKTYQDVHPGVTTMWLGALAFRASDPEVDARMGGQIPTHQVRERVTMPGQLPIDTLVNLRKAVVIANVAIMLATFFCLVAMLGRWTAFASVSFYGLDPMQIGFTRLLPLDGLSTNLLVLAVIAFCLRLSTGSRIGLVVSGVATGLALLTRSVNVALAPLLCLLMLVDLLSTLRPGEPWHRGIPGYFRSFAIWLGIALVTAIAFWPALWVAPLDTLGKEFGGGSDLASAPHQRQVLFRGEIITSDPGWLYYPIVLAYRMSPVTLVALLLSAIALLAPGITIPPRVRRLCLNLAIFAGAYLFVLSLAAKKLDRYLLPSLAALNLIAAIGSIFLIRWLVGRLGVNRALPAFASVACISVLFLGGQALAAHQSAPYYITYVSPLMGGQAAARDQLSLEWGEGGKAVAEAILQHPGIGAGEIAGSAWPSSIDYYLPFAVGEVDYDLDSTGVAWFLSSHYVVVTEPEIQRQFYPPEMIAWFDTLEPLAVVHDDGRIYARIFDLSGLDLPPPYYQHDAPIFVREQKVRLVGSAFRDEITSGADIRVRLYFETMGTPFDYQIEAQVVDARGNVVGVVDKQLQLDDPVEPVIRSLFDVDLPAGLAPGTYEVQLSIRDNKTGDLVKAVRAVTGQNARSPVSVGIFTVVETPETEVVEP
jgi:hypothetical protein